MKKRFYSKGLTILLILVIVIPQVFYGFPGQASAAQTGTVKATMLNVRSQPSITAPKVQQNGTDVYLIQGETVNILDEKGDFYYVSLKFNGKTVKGYVHKDFIKVDAGKTPSPTPTKAPSATPAPTAAPSPTTSPASATTAVPVTKEVEIKATVAATTLNVRSGPGLKYSKIASLGNNSSVTVICEKMSDNTEWYGITFESGGKTMSGYVSSAYIKLSYAKSIKAEVSASKLKIRKTASSTAVYLKNKSGSIIYLKQGKAVYITEETNISGVKWLKITFTYNSVKYTGYTESTQIQFHPTAAAPTTAPKPTESAKPTESPKPTTSVKPTDSPKPTTSVKPTGSPKPTTSPKPTGSPKPTTSPKPTGSPKPTTSPKPTDSPKPTAAPKPTDSPKPTTAPEATPSGPLTPSPDIPDLGILDVTDVTIYQEIKTPMRGNVCNTYLLNAFSQVSESVADFLFDSTYNPVLLKNRQEVIVTLAINIKGSVFYKVDFWYEGIIMTGYVQAEYILINTNTGTDPVVISPSPTPTPDPADQIDPGSLSFEEKLLAEGFPASYIAPLSLLHEQYPNWEFKAYQTGLDWNMVISEESVPGRNLIPNSKGVEWKSLESGAYNWKTDTFTIYDGTSWVTASRAAIEYYMDPRNFLTANGIFQYELLKYQKDYQNIIGVENILKGTAMYNKTYDYVDENGITQTISYAETFIKAAEYSGVSPYHLASRVKQEVVTGSTTLSSSVNGIYPGYEGLYNFYNIGANDSAGGGAVANGLKFAQNGTTNSVTNQLYMIPWTNPFKAIIGGSYFIGGSYINRGQDTIYLQKFNVTELSTYYHQYMSNVEAPYAEAKKILSAYNGMADSPIIFSIPVYLNMPETACPVPPLMYNPNNRLKSLKVFDGAGNELTLTPTFSQTELNYYLMVDNTVDLIEIKAATVSKKATLAGGGIIPLGIGTNEILVPVIAENGDIANYKVTIIRAE